jgi:hypothetical protein
MSRSSRVGGLVFPTTNAWSETAIHLEQPARRYGWTDRGARFGHSELLGRIQCHLGRQRSGPRQLPLDANSAIFSSREGTKPPELVVETGTP